MSIISYIYLLDVYCILWYGWVFPYFANFNYSVNFWGIPGAIYRLFVFTKPITNVSPRLLVHEHGSWRNSDPKWLFARFTFTNQQMKKTKVKKCICLDFQGFPPICLWKFQFGISLFPHTWNFRTFHEPLCFKNSLFDFQFIGFHWKSADPGLA